MAMNQNPPSSNPDPNAGSHLPESAEDALRRARDQIKETGGKIKEQASQFAEAARDKASEIGSKVAETADDLRETVKDRLDDWREGAADIYQRTKARVRHM